MNEPRRHHLLPQFYLRRFANDADQIKVMARDGQKSFVTSVAKAAAETDFYTVETTEGPSQDVEKLLSRIEDLGAQAIERILKTFPPSNDDREHLAMFIAFQITRGRDHRHAWDKMTDYMAKMVLQTIVEGDVQQRLSAATGKPATEKEAEAIRYLAEKPDNWKVVPHPNEAIEAMLDTTPQLVPYIADRKWVLARFRKPLLLTGDTPVTLWRRTDSPRGIGVATADELRFPLDTQYALILSLDGAERVWELHESHAHDLNRSVAGRAYEWVYHHPDHWPLHGLELPPPRQAVYIS
jgi:hypothetical protein